MSSGWKSLLKWAALLALFCFGVTVLVDPRRAGEFFIGLYAALGSCGLAIRHFRKTA